jgi:PBP1b-binding outer membrane lipoprotein LpoB
MIRISTICIAALLLSGCMTTLEVGAHYAKTAYNKCEALDNWQCLWYDE